MSFKDIIGQDKAISIILGTLARNRVPSAYLFAGESGIGKKLTAINLAKAINCQNTVGSQKSLVISQRDSAGSTEGLQTIDNRPTDCCDECLSCKKIEAGTHPDFLAIAPEKGEIRVDEIRAVEEALSLKPFEGRRKVVIIDDADAMNQAAANAFLKTLEEPPDESLLILVTAHPDRLPETIRSRCSRMNFLPLSDKASEEVIKTVMSRSGMHESSKSIKGRKTEKTGDSNLIAMTRLSMGRPGLAFSYNILEGRERFVDLFQNMLGGGSETWSDRDDMERWIDMAFLILRDMAVMKISEGRKSEDDLLNADIRDFVTERSKKTDMTGIMEIYNRMVSLRGQLGFNLNKAITWNYVASVVKTLMGELAA